MDDDRTYADHLNEYFDDYFLDVYDGMFQDPKEKSIECECGAEICGTTHSTWCPKYAE